MKESYISTKDGGMMGKFRRNVSGVGTPPADKKMSRTTSNSKPSVFIDVDRLKDDKKAPNLLARALSRSQDKLADKPRKQNSLKVNEPDAASPQRGASAHIIAPILEAPVLERSAAVLNAPKRAMGPKRKPPAGVAPPSSGIPGNIDTSGDST
jgi:hypothetical protein